jgi:hypothetical protein
MLIYLLIWRLCKESPLRLMLTVLDQAPDPKPTLSVFETGKEATYVIHGL